jgi:hypothetical protein
MLSSCKYNLEPLSYDFAIVPGEKFFREDIIVAFGLGADPLIRIVIRHMSSRSQVAVGFVIG